jgi:hypothetical protein
VTICPEFPVYPDNGSPDGVCVDFGARLVGAGGVEGLLGALVRVGFATGTVIIVRAVAE